MQVRRVIFATGEIYHIYNRSVGREQVFSTHTQLQHIQEAIAFYRYPQTLRLSEYRKLNKDAKLLYDFRLSEKKPYVEIYAFAFMPNHYHLLVKQTADDGIRHFISLIQNSYAKYFNTRYHRHGSLFQSPFQGKWIETDEQFMHVSRYIHLNHVTAHMLQLEQLETYPFSSFMDYIGKRSTEWLHTQKVLGFFSSPTDYKEFVGNQVDYQRTLAKIKEFTVW